MASSWRELSDDIKYEILLYTEKLTMTEMQIMRLLTKGQSEFQRLTHYVQATKSIVSTSTPAWDVGDDVLVPIEIKDLNGTVLMIVDPSQFQDLMDRGPKDSNDYIGYHEPAVHYSRRYEFADKANWGKVRRMATIWANTVLTYPQDTVADATLSLRYIQDLHAFSVNSAQWATFLPVDTNFMAQFDTTGPNAQIARYEDAFVNYAVYRYLESIGHKNALVFRSRFQEYVDQAIQDRPTLFHHGSADYNFAPTSS